MGISDTKSSVSPTFNGDNSRDLQTDTANASELWIVLGLFLLCYDLLSCQKNF
jgi:hypothetical protein